MKLQTFFCILALLLAAPAFPQGNVQKIDQWLVLGPAEILPGDAVLLAGENAVLEYDFLPLASLRPETGLKVQWSTKKSLSWRPAAASFSASLQWQVVYLAVYLETFRWLQADLLVDADFPASVFLDGEVLPKIQGQEKGSRPISLGNGMHLLLLKGVLPPGQGKHHQLAVSLQNKPAFAAETILLSLPAERRLGMEDILNTVNIADVFLSHDGRKVAVTLNQRRRGESESRSWLEILDTENGGTIFNSQGLGVFQNFQWLKNSQGFSFTRNEKELTGIYSYDLSGHVLKPMLAGIKNFSSYWWAPDNSFLIYSTTETEPETDKVFRQVKDIDGRARFQEQLHSLTMFFPESDVRHPLTAAVDNFSSVRISPDNRSLLLVTRSQDPKNRPYYKNTLVLYSLADGKREKILTDPWIEDFAWSPDANKLLLLGGPSAFSGLGNPLPPGVIPNDFDVQAYVFDLKTRKAEALTKQFRPSIDEAFWHPNGAIYFKVTDQDCARIYRCSPTEKKFNRLETVPDMVESIGYARVKKAVYSGSGLASPQKLFVLNLDAGNSRLLKDYNQNEFKHVRFGKVENWNFKTKEGKSISGFITYPPDFNPAQKYPCLVNYYGGTSPVGRDFGGRYPKDWYAANGYIVYVLQPSGAVGFGKEFSALHVNDWGEITAAEIIRGVEELLRSHPFIDSHKIGAIGASYGGFLTQVLASKTDIFAALISHAGISALSSYWGVGDWGYSYSAVASAFSFPWNRKDLYVGHSPLFMAERINKPLLLLHGENDNNVPPGESYQMFAALKLLGKEVALVTFAEQQHWILAYPQRVQWMKTIMAWFDRWLKGQSEQWREMYDQNSP